MQWSSSLHRDGVDDEELRWVGLAVVLLANIGLERAVGGPLELPQLSGKGWTTHLVRQVAGAPQRRVVHSRPCTPI